ncbi:hypothetical protein WKH24_22045 [Pantoea agglomerans]|uniref:hypothetical protein n=1 Tax=Enterobacter agglomerans TaxID=549 RepID=UPI001AA04526|nr:hypothetical protein [Pantoea agglomerans]QTC52542.1 hypothetical protein H0Z11_20605 [Pantoea agglomerans]
MDKHSQRELCIRLCALRLRYQRAWQAQASSCQLAAMLTEIETLLQRQASDSSQPDAVRRHVLPAGASDSVPGFGDVTRSSA